MKRRVDSRSQATRFWERPSHGHRTHFHSSTRETAKHHTNGMRKGHGVTARANSHKEQRATCACSSGIWVATRRHARRRSNPCRRCMSPKQPCAAGGSRISESRSARCRDGGSARRFRVRSDHRKWLMDTCAPRRRARFLWQRRPAACDISRKRRAVSRAAPSPVASLRRQTHRGGDRARERHTARALATTWAETTADREAFGARSLDESMMWPPPSPRAYGARCRCREACACQWDAGGTPAACGAR